MKIFLVHVEVIDGEHTHLKNVLVKADAITTTKLATKNTNKLIKYFSYGDNSTGIRVRFAEEITAVQAKVLTDLNLVSYLH